MAQINYPQNPVKVECDDSVENVTIWFEYNNRITISNHEERVATGKSQYILVNENYVHYNVIEPYEFSKNDKLTLTGMYMRPIW